MAGKLQSKYKRKWLKSAIAILLFSIIFINIIAIFHSYKFTHFDPQSTYKTKDPGKLSSWEKVKTLMFGVSNPRPLNNRFPPEGFETIVLQSNRKIECWRIKLDNAKGTVIIFHGFSGQKSSMLDKVEVFRKLGYNILLVDFMGSGGSEGNQTTIGFLEAEQVRTCYQFLKQQGEKNIYLFGTSMGAVAIMKSINDYNLNPRGILIECPFGSMYQTVCARFKSMNAPTFPMAGLLVLWGGIQNGFWAFNHNPIEYAKKISCPVLLMCGGQDKKVSSGETNSIFANLSGKKTLKIYKDAGHENYLIKYRNEWTQDVTGFLKEN